MTDCHIQYAQALFKINLSFGQYTPELLLKYGI